MKDYIARFILPAAYELLPPAMNRVGASAMVIAIGLQESGFAARRQRHNGPARGFWQFEESGVRAVLLHQRSAAAAEALCRRLCYGGITPAIPAMVLDAIEHNDVLAAGFARLLLWTVVSPLPKPEEEHLSWDQYVAGWRPGKPMPTAWATNYYAGWQTIGVTYGQPLRVAGQGADQSGPAVAGDADRRHGPGAGQDETGNRRT